MFDSPITDIQSATPVVFDLEEPGCMGLWVGPALGQCACLDEFHIIVGRSQTFAVYEVDSSFDLTLVYESEALGTGIGAFDGIVVKRKLATPNNKYEDWIYVGSAAYFYGYKSQVYQLIGSHP
jgi:hypothetical protein